MARLRILAPFFALSLGSVCFGLCCLTYGKGIVSAPSPREAAPYAVPFVLVSAAAAASLAMAGGALCDASEKLSRSSSRSSRSRSRLA